MFVSKPAVLCAATRGLVCALCAHEGMSSREDAVRRHKRGADRMTLLGVAVCL